MTSSDLDDLIEFPCDHTFKAFGPADETTQFEEQVLSAVSEVVPVGRDALRTRGSRQGNYLCVSVLVRIYNRQQLEEVYQSLRRIPELIYLL